jgi:hypothetical protein
VLVTVVFFFGRVRFEPCDYFLVSLGRTVGPALDTVVKLAVIGCLCGNGGW